MSKTARIIIALAVVAIIAVGAAVLAGKQDSQGSKDGASSGSGDASESSNQTASATITYTDDGFGPASVTVASGAGVKVVNQSSETIKPSSNPHPDHTDNPALNMGDIEPGESKTVTVTEKGSWGYHNHYKEDNGGTIIVE